MTWKPIVSEALTAREIEAVLSRSVPYVHVPRFLDPDWCREVAQRFSSAIAELPDHQRLRMGPMTFDTLARPVEMFVDAKGGNDYFEHVPQDAPRVRSLFDRGIDPLSKVRSAWAEAGFVEVAAAEDEHRRYHPDAVWGIRSAYAPPHVDSYERDRELRLSRFPRRLNFNVYIQNPDSGGNFAIYNRCAATAPPGTEPWSMNPEQAAELLAGAERLEHRPSPGDLVIFDAMFFHEVMHVDGSKAARIQQHSSILVDPDTREFLFFV